MDDMRMIRNFLKEAPPSAEVVAEGRRRLAEGPARDTARKRRRLWRGLTVLGAATAAVGLAIGLSGGPASPKREEPVGPLSARQVLLTAAESAAHTPSNGKGAYWFTHFQTGSATVVTGRAGRYVVYQRSEQKDWTDAHSPARTNAETKAGRGGSTTHYFGEKDLGTHPIGAANVAAWRRDGSPARWSVPIPGHSPAHISMTAGPWEIHKEQTAFNEAFGDGSLEELGALPTDPARLRARFLSETQRSQGGRQSYQSPDQWAFDAAGYLLTNEPVPTRVRVAAYRVLAALPGVRTAGTVPDPLGRVGTAVELRGVSGPGTNDRIIVEPSTGRLLARESFAVAPTAGYPAGTMLAWQALVDAGWTDRAPGHATDLPG
jgi:hypothetical protein